MKDPLQIIPDGCNAGIVLRLALGVNLALVLAVLVGGGFRGAEPGEMAAVFLQDAALVEPVMLLTLLSWCLMRRVTWPFGDRALRLFCWVLPGVMAVLVIEALLAGQGVATAHFDAMALGASVMGGALGQHYFELRARAFSPAIDEARFQALQSRIRPHFLFNSLNAVLAVVRDDPVKAERMLESLAELFRAVMGDVNRLVPLDTELDLCRRYVEIEQTRLGERLQVFWDLSAVHPKARVPQLLLQPIIENAVRYGAERASGTCTIRVRVLQHGFRLHIRVSNPIAKEPVQREGNQIGLNNIRGRLALIYDLEATLETRIKDGRFELSLSLPVERTP